MFIFTLGTTPKSARGTTPNSAQRTTPKSARRTTLNSARGTTPNLARACGPRWFFKCSFLRLGPPQNRRGPALIFQMLIFTFGMTWKIWNGPSARTLLSNVNFYGMEGELSVFWLSSSYTRYFFYKQLPYKQQYWDFGENYNRFYCSIVFENNRKQKKILSNSSTGRNSKLLIKKYRVVLTELSNNFIFGPWHNINKINISWCFGENSTWFTIFCPKLLKKCWRQQKCIHNGQLNFIFFNIFIIAFIWGVNHFSNINAFFYRHWEGSTDFSWRHRKNANVSKIWWRHGICYYSEQKY